MGGAERGGDGMISIPAGSPPDLVVVWRVTELCNLGCHFCGYSRHLHRPRHSADVEEVLRFGKLLGDYSAATGRTTLVSWLGGEPLLWPPLSELSRAFTERFNLQVSVTTNGVPLSSRQTCEDLAAWCSQLTVSVDGIGPVHDDCRDSPGLFDRLQENLSTLQETIRDTGSSLKLRANTILMRKNVLDFERLCLTLAAWGIQELTFNQLGGNDRPEYYPENRLLPDQADWLCRELPGIRQRLARQGLHILGSEKYLERFRCTSRDVPIPILDCAPGQSFLFIDERGTISPCSFTVDGYGIPSASLRSPEQLSGLPELFRRMRRDRMLSPCLDCHSTQVFDKFPGPSPTLADGQGSSPFPLELRRTRGSTPSTSKDGIDPVPPAGS